MRNKKKWITALSILAAMFIGCLIPSCAPSHSPDPEPKTGPKYVAHRGYSHSYVANTEEAFRAAAQMGFYGIETDIRKTKDDLFVCNHDATVLYADGTEKTITSSDRAALLADPIKNDKTDGDAYLCTFETYLQACKSGGKVAVIELKEYFGDADIRKILSIVDDEYDRKKVSFISFYYYPLSLIKKADPSIPLQYLSQTEGDRTFERCLKDGVSVDVRQTILTDELVQTFHDKGLTVNVWTVNEASDLDVVIQKGVDYITTDVFQEE